MVAFPDLEYDGSPRTNVLLSFVCSPVVWKGTQVTIVVQADNSLTFPAYSELLKILLLATVVLGVSDFVYCIIALFVSVVSGMDHRHGFGAQAWL